MRIHLVEYPSEGDILITREPVFKWLPWPVHNILTFFPVANEGIRCIKSRKL